MPLLVNIGVNRKRSHDFQSRGYSINVTAELDPALLGNAQRLQDEIAALYRHAEVALDAQMKRAATTDSAQLTTPSTRGAPSNSARRSDPPPRSVTQSQLRALHDLAESLNSDLGAIAQEVFARAPRDLNIREASRLIDQLKARVQRERSAQHVAANGTHAVPPSQDDDHRA